jgi:hypothetical protein
MKFDRIEERVRHLAHMLAYEEEASTRSSSWYERKKEHDKLLNKLYRLQKKM